MNNTDTVDLSPFLVSQTAFELFIADSIDSERGLDFALQKDAELNYTTNWVQQRWLGWQAAVTFMSVAANASE